MYLFTLTPLLLSALVASLPLTDEKAQAAPLSITLGASDADFVETHAGIDSPVSPDFSSSEDFSREEQLQLVLESLPMKCTGLDGQKVTEDRTVMDKCLANFAARANNPEYGADKAARRRMQKRQVANNNNGNRVAAGNNNNRADRNNNNNNANRAGANNNANRAGGNNNPNRAGGNNNAAAKPAAGATAVKAPAVAATNLQSIDLATFSQSIDLKDIPISKAVTPAPVAAPVAAVTASVPPAIKAPAAPTTPAAPAAPLVAIAEKPTLAPLPAGSTGIAPTSQQLAVVKAVASGNAGKTVGVAAPAAGLVAIKATA